LWFHFGSCSPIIGAEISRYLGNVGEFYNLENAKFSTSRGHLIWAREIAQTYSADLVRFYTALSAPGFEQSNFNTSVMQEVIERRLLAPYRRIVANVNAHSGDAMSSENISKINSALCARVASHLTLNRFNLRHSAEDTIKGLDAIESLQTTSGLSKAGVITMLLNWAHVVTPLMPGLAATLIRALENGQIPFELLHLKADAHASALKEEEAHA
jgi:methionyl-tRNA synthetase